MKPLALASQQTTIATNLFAVNVLGTGLTKRYHPLTVAYISYTRFWYFDVCKQLYFSGLFYIVVLIYAVDCPFADIISDGVATVCGIIVRVKVDSMDVGHEEILRLYENPYEYDVWKPREKIGPDNDYRSRRKGTKVGKDKLNAYDDVTAAKKGDTDDKLKDTTISYSYLDEYCKVSAPKPTDDNSIEDITSTRPLKTNTAFGRSKIPFEKFAQHHIGGGIVDCTSQPVAPQTGRSQADDTRIRSAEGTTTNSTSDYYDVDDDDETLRCCGANIDNAVDYCTCMYCVKGLFYHCTKDSCPENRLVEPFSCSPVGAGCIKRWSAFGVLAIILPCLICYPVASGCTEICKCYKKQQASVKERRERTFQSRNRLR